MGRVDLAVVAAYLAASVFLGVRAARRGSSREDDYLLAGRTLTLPAFVATLVSTWYGGVLGVGEYSWTFGISNWLVLGAPYYLGALLFALLFARRARERPDYTIPDLLYATYGKGAGAIGTAVVFALSLPAAYLLMLGVLLRRMTGLDQRAGVALAAAFCVAYVAARGFRGVVGPKGLQFALMYGGFLLILPFAVHEVGGIGSLREALPAGHWSALGGRPPAYVVAWYFIALQTLVEPTFFQRCFAARSPRTARLGVFLSIPCFAVFDGLTTVTGMYARAALPELPSAVDAFPALGEALLPVGLLGAFVAGLIATILSTVDSFLFVGGVTFGRDLVWRLSGGRADQVRWSRIGLLIAAGLASAVAVASESVVSLWYGFGSVGTAVLLPPLLGAFFPRWRAARRAATWGMAAAGATTLVWLLPAMAGTGGMPWLGVEPIYPGLSVALLAHAVGVVSSRRGR